MYLNGGSYNDYDTRYVSAVGTDTGQTESRVRTSTFWGTQAVCLTDRLLLLEAQARSSGNEITAGGSERPQH